MKIFYKDFFDQTLFENDEFNWKMFYKDFFDRTLFENDEFNWKILYKDFLDRTVLNMMDSIGRQFYDRGYDLIVHIKLFQPKML